MVNRPTWRTPAFETKAAPNAHILKRVRTPFGQFVDGDGRTQCKAVARSTGLRCRQNAIQGAECCQFHGGLRYLERRIAKAGGRVAAHCVPTPNVKRRYDVACAFELDHLSDKLSKAERTELSQMGLSARGRKLQEVARRELNR